MNSKLEKSATAKRLRRYAGVDEPLETVIQQIVESLLGDVPQRPTNLECLYSKLGIECAEPDDELLFSGELRRSNQGLRIFHRPDLSPTRLRFTLAHELGHAILAKTGPRARQTGDEVERICDMFAAEMLMPVNDLRRGFPGKPRVETIANVAAAYGVSHTAAARRISDLWQVGAFGVTEGRVTWRARVRPEWLAGADSTFTSSVERAMQGEPGSERVTFSTGSRWTTHLMEWLCFKQNRSAIFLLTN